MSTATDSCHDADTGVDVRALLAVIDGDLAGLAFELTPERIPGHVVTRVVALLGRIERRAGGARLVLHRRSGQVRGLEGQRGPHSGGVGGQAERHQRR